MGARESTFRGYWSIAAVMEDAKELGEWMTQFRPSCKTITLKRTNLDLICRWPKAAAMFEIEFYGEVVMWKGFVLRADTGPSRYEKPTHSETADGKTA